MEEQKNETTKAVSTNDTTPKVTGIGGIFFFSDNPKETREWYHKNLGLETNDYGSTFESRNVNRPDEINTLQWSLFKKGSEYFAPSKKEFMINYIVQNIEGLIAKLKENGVTILDDIVTYGYTTATSILGDAYTDFLVNWATMKIRGILNETDTQVMEALKLELQSIQSDSVGRERGMKIERNFANIVGSRPVRR